MICKKGQIAMGPAGLCARTQDRIRQQLAGGVRWLLEIERQRPLFWNLRPNGAVVAGINPTVALVLANADMERKERLFYYDEQLKRELSREEWLEIYDRWDAEWEKRFEQEPDKAKALREWDAGWEWFYAQYPQKRDEAFGKWLCMLMELDEEGRTLAVGDRLPCSVALGGPDLERGLWRGMVAYPFAWETDDPGELEGLAEEVSGFEWRRLQELIPFSRELMPGKCYLIREDVSGLFTFEDVDPTGEAWRSGGEETDAGGAYREELPRRKRRLPDSLVK